MWGQCLEPSPKINVIAALKSVDGALKTTLVCLWSNIARFFRPGIIVSRSVTCCISVKALVYLCNTSGCASIALLPPISLSHTAATRLRTIAVRRNHRVERGTRPLWTHSHRQPLSHHSGSARQRRTIMTWRTGRACSMCPCLRSPWRWRSLCCAVVPSGVCS